MSLRHNDPPTYDPEMVQPLRDELKAAGFRETHTPLEFEESIGGDNEKTTLLVINSVCGCSAGSSRPGICKALQYNTIPDNLVTVFAGQDTSVLNHIRNDYLGDFPPSSPNVALFRGDSLISFLPRAFFQTNSADEVTEALIELFDQNCNASGPSISPAHYDELTHAISCGSKIPRFDGQAPSC